MREGSGWKRKGDGKGKGKETGKTTSETVPSQADLFKAEGKREIEARSKETLKQRSYYSVAGAGDTTTAINTISNTRRSNVATELSLLLVMLNSVSTERD